MKKGAPVGVDSTFREICVGDIVRDADGKEYTVDEYGRAKPLNGVDNVVPLKRLRGLIVESERDAAMAERSWLDAITRQVEARKSEIVRQYAPNASPAAAPKPVARLEDFRKDGHPGGRENESGMVRIYNIARSTGVNAAEIRKLAAENGINIVKHGSAPSIRIEDRKRMLSIIRDAMAGRRSRSSQPDPAPDPAPEKEQSNDSPPDGGTASRVEEILGSVEDSELAQELRRRGWEVVATKRL